MLRLCPVRYNLGSSIPLGILPQLSNDIYLQTRPIQSNQTAQHQRTNKIPQILRSYLPPYLPSFISFNPASWAPIRIPIRSKYFLPMNRNESPQLMPVKFRRKEGEKEASQANPNNHRYLYPILYTHSTGRYEPPTPTIKTLEQIGIQADRNVDHTRLFYKQVAITLIGRHVLRLQ